MASSNISLSTPLAFIGGKKHNISAMKMMAQLRAYDHGGNKSWITTIARKFPPLLKWYIIVSGLPNLWVSNLETTKQVWDELEEKFFGNEKTKHMQVLNFRRKQLQGLKKNEYETIKDFMSRLMKEVNQIILAGKNFQTTELLKKPWLSCLKSLNPRFLHLKNQRIFVK